MTKQQEKLVSRLDLAAQELFIVMDYVEEEKFEQALSDLGDILRRLDKIYNEIESKVDSDYNK